MRFWDIAKYTFSISIQMYTNRKAGKDKFGHNLIIEFFASKIFLAFFGQDI